MPINIIPTEYTTSMMVPVEKIDTKVLAEITEKDLEDITQKINSLQTRIKAQDDVKKSDEDEANQMTKQLRNIAKTFEEYKTLIAIFYFESDTF